jgi:hypothetical protein
MRGQRRGGIDASWGRGVGSFELGCSYFPIQKSANITPDISIDRVET